MMGRLAVIGLDGASWPYIVRRLDRLPTFQRLLAEERSGPLLCDVEPIHSGPCWATLLAGDDLGLTDFARGRDAQRIRASAHWLWAGLEQEAVVVGVPVTLPPITLNADDRGWLQTSLSVTLQEMEQSTYRRAAQTASALRMPGVTLVVSVWPALDRAGHFFGMEAPETLQVYEAVDGQLARLLPMLAGWQWVILSDHGIHSRADVQYPGQETLADGRKGWHAPEGIFLTNIPGRRCPRRASEVYSWLMDVLMM